MIKASYTVSVAERIKELLGVDYLVGPDDYFEYSFNHGYERYRIQHDEGGSSDYGGSYHPDVVCETESGNEVGICKWCGRTLM